MYKFLIHAFYILYSLYLRNLIPHLGLFTHYPFFVYIHVCANKLFAPSPSIGQTPETDKQT